MVLTNKQNLYNLVELIRSISIEFEVMNLHLEYFSKFDCKSDYFKEIIDRGERTTTYLKSNFEETIDLFPNNFLIDLEAYSITLDENIIKIINKMNWNYSNTYYIISEDILLNSYIDQIHNMAYFLEESGAQINT